MATTVNTIKGRTPSVWSQQMRQKFKSGIATTFIIHGNVRDVIDERLTLNTYLAANWLQRVDGKRKFDLIIFYNRATGIYLPTPEMETLFLRHSGLDISATSATTGIFPAGNKKEVPIPKDPATALKLIEKVLRTERFAKDHEGKDDPDQDLHTVVIIDHAETLFPSGNMGQLQDADRDRIVMMREWAKDPQLSAAANPVFLVTDSVSDLHESLTANSSRIEQIELLLPAPEERLAFIEFLDDTSKKVFGGPLKFADGYNKRQFAHQTAGLAKLAIEDVTMAARLERKPISADLVKDRKREIFASEYQSVIEMVDPENGFEAVGGFPWLKTFFREDVIKPMLDGDTGRVPMGVLFAGASGTGKTVLAEAIAYEAGINMVKLDIGKMLGQYIGQSEAACRKAFSAIRSLFPCLVFLDEADQAVNRGSHGDSGVSDRIFKMVLEFMSDTRNRGKVFFILATNRVDNLDPALKRPGRIDKIIPFLPPNAGQRAEIFPAIIGRYHYELDGKIDFNQLAIETEDWVGSDIEGALVKAYATACRDGRKKIRQADIAHALEAIIPATQSVAHWTNLALLECNDTDLLPPDMRKEFAKKKKDIQRDVDKVNKRGASFLDPAPRRTREEL